MKSGLTFVSSEVLFWACWLQNEIKRLHHALIGDRVMRLRSKGMSACLKNMRGCEEVTVALGVGSGVRKDTVLELFEMLPFKLCALT
jgi:hypothetical protein